MNLNNYPNLKARVEKLAKSNNGSLYMGIGFACFGVLAIMANEAGRRAGEGNSKMMLLCVFVFFASSISYLMEHYKASVAVKGTWDAFDAKEMDAIEAEAENAVALTDTLIGKSFVLTKSEYGPMAIKMKDIVWIYEQDVPRKVFGIPNGKSKVLVIIDRYGRRYYTSTSKLTKNNATECQNRVLEAVRCIKSFRPHVLVGMSDELVNLAKNDMPALIRRADGADQSAPLATYGWEMSTDEGTVQNPTPVQIEEALLQLQDEAAEHMMLTPQNPIKGIYNIRIQYEETYIVSVLREGQSSFEEIGRGDIEKARCFIDDYIGRK